MDDDKTKPDPDADTVTDGSATTKPDGSAKRSRGKSKGATGSVFVDYLGSAEVPSHLQAAHAVSAEGQDLLVLRPGLNCVEATKWKAYADHPGIVGRVAVLDEIPKQTADMLALIRRTVCPDALTAIAKAESERRGKHARTVITAGVEAQVARARTLRPYPAGK